MSSVIFCRYLQKIQTAHIKSKIKAVFIIQELAPECPQSLIFSPGLLGT